MSFTACTVILLTFAYYLVFLWQNALKGSGGAYILYQLSINENLNPLTKVMWIDREKAVFCTLRNSQNIKRGRNKHLNTIYQGLCSFKDMLKYGWFEYFFICYSLRGQLCKVCGHIILYLLLGFPMAKFGPVSRQQHNQVDVNLCAFIKQKASVWMLNFIGFQ